MATVAAVASSNLQASGFFVLRTPLLPVDELRAWSDGLHAAEAAAQMAKLEAARGGLSGFRRQPWARPRWSAARGNPRIRSGVADGATSVYDAAQSA